MATRKSTKPALSAVPGDDIERRATQASSELHYTHIELACLGKLLQMASDGAQDELTNDDLFALGRMLISRAQAVEEAALILEHPGDAEAANHG